MDWQIIVALVVMVPVILLPLLLVWYFNIGAVLSAVREVRASQLFRRKEGKITAKAE